MTTYKEYYFVNARTKSGKLAHVSFWTTLDLAIEAFKKKYPRFSGQGMIYKTACEVIGGNGENEVCMVSAYNTYEKQIIKEFTSNKEL